MKEFHELFFSSYLVSSIFLLPLLGLYLGLSLKKVSLRSIILFHKLFTLLAVSLPVAMVLMSYSADHDLGAHIPKKESRHQPEILNQTAVPGPYMGGASDSRRVGSVKHIRPIIQDVSFYFVDLIGQFSILGLLIFAIRYRLQMRRIHRLKQTGVLSIISGGYHLVESIGVKTPFSAGFIRKSIFIPASMTAFEKKVIICHEVNHFRCHHHFWSLLETVLAYMFWFNPISHILRRRGVFLRELECDQRTIRKIDKFEYTRLLIQTAAVIAAGGGDPRETLLTQGWIRKSELRKRIEMLMHTNTLKRKALIGLLIAVAVVATAGITLLYGNPNDATMKEILAEVKREYQQKIPEAARIDIEGVPQPFITALLINEDSNFYNHRGLAITSVIRAAGVNLKSYCLGGPLYRQGGSTITQQLAKQFIQDRQKTLKHKFQELKIAKVLEMNFTKNEILEMYLDMIYFGNGAFGLKAASMAYFGHDYKKLTLSEAAMLVPFITAPKMNNVLNDPIGAKRRQQQLLNRIRTAKNS